MHYPNKNSNVFLETKYTFRFLWTLHLLEQQCHKMWDFFLPYLLVLFQLGIHHSNVLSVMSFNLKALQSRFFFFLLQRTCFWLLRHLLFPGWGSDAYYSTLSCSAIIKSLEGVPDWPDSDVIFENIKKSE